MEDVIDDHHQLSKPYAIQLTDVTVNVLKSLNLSIEQGGM
jgi:hypothetical protein